MKYLTHCLLPALFFVALSGWSQSNQMSNAQEISGNWTIDLRPGPEAADYFQSMVIELTEDNQITGTFYGSAIQDGLVNTVWPQLRFAFTTADANHSYYHSGYLEDGVIHGITYCPGRNFVMPWTGTKL